MEDSHVGDDGSTAHATVSAEDLRRALGYDKAQRNPLLVRMRKRFPQRMADVGEDETGFYQAFVDLAEDAATRTELTCVLNELLRGRNGKWQFAYSLLLRLSERTGERLKTLPAADGKAIVNEADLYRDALTLERLAAHGEAFWARVYRWAVRLGLDRLPSGDLPLATAVRQLLLQGAGPDANHDQTAAADETAGIGDPLASWQQSRAGLAAAIAVLDERPSVEAACELKTLALRLWQSASLWADTGRLDAVRTRLAAMLAELAPLAGEAVSCAQAGLADRQWSAQDAEWLETQVMQIEERADTVREATAAFREVESALDAARADKRFLDLANLAIRADAARQREESAQAALTTLLQTLAADPDTPDTGLPEPEPEPESESESESEDLPSEPSAPSTDACTASYPDTDAPPVAVAPALPDVGSLKTPFQATTKPLSRAVGEALKSAAPVQEWSWDATGGQPHADISPDPVARNTGEPVTLQAAGDDGGPAPSIEPVDADAGSTIYVAIPSVSPPSSAAVPERTEATSSTHALGPVASAPERSDSFGADVDPARVGAIIWQAVADHRCGLAWHLARAVPSALEVPPALFAALALAPCVRSTDDEASVLFGQQAELLTGAGSAGSGMLQGEAIDLLRFAAAARPMLLSPYLTNAQQLLLDAPALESLDGFRELRRTLLDTLAQGMNLTPTLLQGGYPQAQWNLAVQTLRDEASGWLREAPTRNTNFHRATVAWKHWSSQGGEMADIVTELAQADPWPLETLQNFRERLRSIDTELDRMLEESDRRQAKAPIDGKARKKLLEYFEEVRNLLVRALELHEARPRDQDRMQVVDDLRHRLREQIRAALPSLESWRTKAATEEDGAHVTAAVQCAQHTLRDLQALLGDTDGMAITSRTPWAALYGDLLLAADIIFADDWHPHPAPDARILVGLVEQAPTVVEALESRCACGDLRAARRLLDQPLQPIQDAEILEERLADLGNSPRRKTRERHEKLRTRLELMLQQGVLDEPQYSDAIETLKSYVDSPTGDLRLWQQRCNAIDSGIDRALVQRREVLRSRLAALDAPDLRQRIEHLLDNDDLLTAHEYLDHCERGEPLPQEQRGDGLRLEAFFPALAQASARTDQRPQRDDVLARRPLGTVRLDDLPDERLDSSAELIDVWRDLENSLRRRPGRSTATSDTTRAKSLLTRLFTALDFVDVEIGSRTEPGIGTVTTHTLRCQPLTDRAFCPVPQYGSQANGQYVLRCLDAGPEVGVDALLAKVRDLRGAAFALVPGWLDDSMRRELAQVCRTQRQTVLLIDEALIQALAGVAGDRRRALFEWTLPFTWLNPFSITASRVPPELFHGRQRALELVRNPREGFLVYGGRQLGKTALLTMTEHDCHRPTEERLALRIDLKSEGIGYGQGPGELWEAIARHLNGLKLGIVDDRVVQQAFSDGGKALRQRLQSWLKAKPFRQLLLMLDEADAFMLKDADADHPFEVLGRLKSLMEESDHRFKVVLAGLRDVQRMARIAQVPNSPLAHLGRSICVGPLLADGESVAARRLLEAPLRALGFRFESTDLPNRILALANYYPSLIQVFGYCLIEHMTQRGGMLAGPPYRIGSQHIDDTFRQASLRDEFVKRFRMTVALDPRYHLIALLIAQDDIDRRQPGSMEAAGVDTIWVRNEALKWWPRGFARQASFEDFCTLLGEMVGLGVLRVISGSVNAQPSYALRSPGIVQMLGGSESIYHALEGISASEPPQLYDADVFHPYLVNETGPRSPLTGRQEERLVALRREAGQPVLALIGTAFAATSDQLPKLVARYDRHNQPVPDLIDSVESLCDWLSSDKNVRISASASQDGFPLVVVPASVPWLPSWLDVTAAWLQERRLRSHVLFVGNEMTAWRWITSGAGERTELLRMLPWTPRAIRQWLLDCSCELGDREFERLLELSGGWGRLLETFGERINGSRNRSPIDKALGALADEPLTNKMDWPDPAIEATLGVLLKLVGPDGRVSGISAELIATELDPAFGPRVKPSLRWAEQLGLLEYLPGTGGTPDWHLNSLLSRLLESKD